MLDRTPQVFISYSWTSEEYKQRVKELAERLIHDGINVKLDIWDLKDGQDKYVYMEQCVTDNSIDRVLILSDRVYKEKADKRQGGVGDETTIISPELYSNAAEVKFIPVVMERDENGNPYLPAYLKSRIYRDFSGSEYEEEYENLVRTIYDEPLNRKPELGARPIWLNKESSQIYFLKEATRRLKAVSSGRLRNIEAQDFIDAYIESIKQFYRSGYENSQDYINDLTALKEYRDRFLDYLKVVSDNKEFGLFLAGIFENLYNILYYVKTFNNDVNGYSEDSFDIFKLHIWELFICTTTYLIHNQLYSDLYSMLHHTYFLRDYPTAETLSAVSYERLRFHSRLLEEQFKPQMPHPLDKKYSLTGHYIVNEREYLPIYTKKEIANADLFLYQVYNGMGLDDLTRWSPWFPTLYIYADSNEHIWKRLKSKVFCNKVMPLFGARTIDQLKEAVSKCRPDSRMRYNHLFADPAPAILSCISIDDIATLP